MILTRDGKKIVAIYKQNGDEVDEVYGGLNYTKPIFYSLKTLTGATSYSFMGYPEPLKSYEIGGNMIQNGTPAPTSPIYPQECGDKTENLLEITNDIKTSTKWVLSPPLGIEGKRYFEVYDITDAVPRGIISAKVFENFEPGYKPGMLVCAITPENTETVDFEYRILNNNGVATPKTFDTTSWDSVYLCIGYGNGFISESTKQQKIDELFNNWKIMLNVGSTALPYEPYGYKISLNLNGTTQNLYLTEPLRKINNYADSISSAGMVTRRIMKLVLTGTESWERGVYSGHHSFQTIAQKTQIGTINCVCNHYRALFRETNNVIYFINPQSSRFVIFDDRFTSSEDFKSFLAERYAAGTPVTVWYVISAPTTEQVTAPTLTPATGNNTLAIGTTLQPSSVSITGHIKPSS